MKITKIDPQPISQLRYLNAASGGGTEVTRLPVLRAVVDELPDGLEAMVVTSDLQGVAPSMERGGQSVLLGEALCEHLAELARDGVIGPLDATGAILAGDLYSDIDARKRGATGDVSAVWEAFAATFSWVVGVAGNHDTLPSLGRWTAERSRARLVDGSSVVFDGLRVAGVCGVVGNKRKNQRRTDREFIAAVRSALAKPADIMVLHDGPPGTERRQPGNSALVSPLSELRASFVVCGHRHWPRPLANLAGGGQVLNVDGRVVILARG